MKQAALLQYTFLFDPSETWAHLSQFEGMLADYLGERGLQAEIVPTLGSNTGRVIMISKKTEPVIMEADDNKSAKQQIDNIKKTKLKT